MLWLRPHCGSHFAQVVVDRVDQSHKGVADQRLAGIVEAEAILTKFPARVCDAAFDRLFHAELAEFRRVEPALRNRIEIKGLGARLPPVQHGQAFQQQSIGSLPIFIFDILTERDISGDHTLKLVPQALEFDEVGLSRLKDL